MPLDRASCGCSARPPLTAATVSNRPMNRSTGRAGAKSGVQTRPDDCSSCRQRVVSQPCSWLAISRAAAAPENPNRSSCTRRSGCRQRVDSSASAAGSTTCSARCTCADAAGADTERQSDQVVVGVIAGTDTFHVDRHEGVAIASRRLSGTAAAGVRCWSGRCRSCWSAGSGRSNHHPHAAARRGRGCCGRPRARLCALLRVPSKNRPIRSKPTSSSVPCDGAMCIPRRGCVTVARKWCVGEV